MPNQTAPIASMPPQNAATAAAIQSQWAAFYQCHLNQQQQQQQQYPYANATAWGNATHQQMNAATAVASPYLYNQAAAWHAWQMSTAGKFQQNPTAAAAVAMGYPYEFLNYMGGAGTSAGAAMSGGTLTNPWPTGFNQIRHPTASSQAQQSFYQAHHPPPM